eukprot:m.273350 g.273350  ORF g.273350 m.273350 type:complete len:1471 (-) comp17684_c0_seq18:29-4441(-)
MSEISHEEHAELQHAETWHPLVDLLRKKLFETSPDCREWQDVANLFAPVSEDVLQQLTLCEGASLDSALSIRYQLNAAKELVSQLCSLNASRAKRKTNETKRRHQELEMAFKSVRFCVAVGTPNYKRESDRCFEGLLPSYDSRPQQLSTVLSGGEPISKLRMEHALLRLLETENAPNWLAGLLADLKHSDQQAYVQVFINGVDVLSTLVSTWAELLFELGHRRYPSDPMWCLCINQTCFNRALALLANAITPDHGTELFCFGFYLTSTFTPAIKTKMVWNESIDGFTKFNATNDIGIQFFCGSFAHESSFKCKDGVITIGGSTSSFRIGWRRATILKLAFQLHPKEYEELKVALLQVVEATHQESKICAGLLLEGIFKTPQTAEVSVPSCIAREVCVMGTQIFRLLHQAIKEFKLQGSAGSPICQALDAGKLLIETSLEPSSTHALQGVGFLGLEQLLNFGRGCADRLFVTNQMSFVYHLANEASAYHASLHETQRLHYRVLIPAMHEQDASIDLLSFLCQMVGSACGSEIAVTCGSEALATSWIGLAERLWSGCDELIKMLTSNDNFLIWLSTSSSQVRQMIMGLGKQDNLATGFHESQRPNLRMNSSHFPYFLWLPMRSLIKRNGMGTSRQSVWFSAFPSIACIQDLKLEWEQLGEGVTMILLTLSGFQRMMTARPFFGHDDSLMVVIDSSNWYSKVDAKADRRIAILTKQLQGTEDLGEVLGKNLEIQTRKNLIQSLLEEIGRIRALGFSIAALELDDFSIRNGTTVGVWRLDRLIAYGTPIDPQLEGLICRLKSRLVQSPYRSCPALDNRRVAALCFEAMWIAPTTISTLPPRSDLHRAVAKRDIIQPLDKGDISELSKIERELLLFASEPAFHLQSESLLEIWCSLEGTDQLAKFPSLTEPAAKKVLLPPCFIQFSVPNLTRLITPSDLALVNQSYQDLLEQCIKSGDVLKHVVQQYTAVSSIEQGRSTLQILQSLVAFKDMPKVQDYELGLKSDITTALSLGLNIWTLISGSYLSGNQHVHVKILLDSSRRHTMSRSLRKSEQHIGMVEMNCRLWLQVLVSFLGGRRVFGDPYSELLRRGISTEWTHGLRLHSAITGQILIMHEFFERHTPIIEEWLLNQAFELQRLTQHFFKTNQELAAALSDHGRLTQHMDRRKILNILSQRSLEFFSCAFEPLGVFNEYKATCPVWEALVRGSEDRESSSHLSPPVIFGRLVGAQYPNLSLKEKGSKPMVFGASKEYVARVDPNPGLFDDRKDLIEAQLVPIELNTTISIYQLFQNTVDSPFVELKAVLFTADSTCSIFKNFEADGFMTLDKFVTHLKDDDCREVWRCQAAVLEAIIKALKLGLVHRDLHSGNVCYNQKTGVAKLLDLSSARLIGDMRFSSATNMLPSLCLTKDGTDSVTTGGEDATAIKRLMAELSRGCTTCQRSQASLHHVENTASSAKTLKVYEHKLKVLKDFRNHED